mmetsp:Transcript_38785/g.70622  ORF Transcript_38785/g.70622 Transcript_38785/m.70622 type:complete len:433 (+) Transcript_38785:48-1346(+)
MAATRRLRALSRQLCSGSAPLLSEVELDDSSGQRLYEQACTFIVTMPDIQCLDSHMHYRAHSDEANHDRFPREDQSRGSSKKVHMTLGYGNYSFAHQGVCFEATHRSNGSPQGTFSTVQYNHTLHIRAPGAEHLRAFLEAAVEHAMTKDSDEVRVWKFTNLYGEWQWMPSIRVASRPLETVVLPDESMQEVLLSLDDFFSKAAAAWYRQHGIPYRRSLLFHGVPGAGKTSLARALATHYGRDICFLSPLHPKLYDANLKHAFETAPSRSIVVLEDIDTLFEGRRSLNSKFPITFSGLLNAIDGIGMSEGSLTIITTNKHPDHFDPALFRPGRIDLKVYFDYVGAEQMGKMFRQFYPQDAALSVEFAARVSQYLRQHNLHISCATLQEFFMRMRNHSAVDALQLSESYGWAEHREKRKEVGGVELPAEIDAAG